MYLCAKLDRMKHILKWAGIAAATLLALIFLLMFLLYLPPVQDFAVRKVTTYLSEQTGMDVSVERLRLSFLLDLDLQQLAMTDSEGDTLVAADHALVDLDFKAIMQRRVKVDAITLTRTQLDTKEWIASTLIRGRLEKLALQDDIDLKEQHVALNSVEVHGLNLDIALRDTTTEEDTTTSAPIEWIIDIQRAAIEDACVRFVMDGDSALEVQTGIRSLVATEGHIDLDQQLYTVGEAKMQADSLRFWPSGKITEPLAQNDLTLEAEKFTFDGERSYLSVPTIKLNTPSSNMQGDVKMEFDAFEAGQNNQMAFSLTSSWGPDDLRRLLAPWLPADFSKEFFRYFPNSPIDLNIGATGNVDCLNIGELLVRMPESFNLFAAGNIHSLTTPASQRISLSYEMQTQNLRWLTSWLDLQGVRLPPMEMNGEVTATDAASHYEVNTKLRERGGLVKLQGSLDTRGDLSYDAHLQAHSLNLDHFLPADSLGIVSLNATARGNGTDLLAPATHIDATTQLTSFHYKQMDLSGLQLEARVARGRGHARLHSDTEQLSATADIDALLGRQLTDLTFALDLSRADLHALGLVDHPLKTSMCLHLDGTTDLRSSHELHGHITDIILMPHDSIFRPEDVRLRAWLTPDTTHVFLSSGDLLLNANGRTGYDRLLEQLGHFTDEFSRQMQERRLDTEALAHRLPQIDFHLRSGEHNPVHDILKAMGYGFNEARLDLNLDPLVGINGRGHIYSLNPGAIQLDTIRMEMYQDSTGVKMEARVCNGRRNPQITFDARLSGYFLPSGAGANLIYYDDRGRKGVDLGLLATIEEEGFRLHLNPLNPILAYRTFHLNDNNYVMLGRGNRISADLDLLADDGTGLKLYSSPNEEALQDLSISLNRFNLGELMTVLPYAPRLTGFLHGDTHLIQTAENLSVSTDLTVNNMTFEGAPLGQIGLQAVYLPESDGSHFINGTLMQTGVPVASVSGSYTPSKTDGQLDIAATLDRLPFSLANGFIPNGLARLEGVAIGDVYVGGTTTHPKVNGQINSSGLRILSDAYSLDLRFQNDTILLENSDLRFDNIQVYSTGKNPITINGGINFSDLSRINIDTRLRANNFELINAKKTRDALAYGKVFVDLNAMLRGTTDNLRLMGQLKVLDDTDVTYVLTDSPLSDDDQLEGLVEFVDFSDTLKVEEYAQVHPQNLNIMMNITIDDAAKVHCLLGTDGKNYVNLEGGGDLLLSYTPEKDMQLNGRYTVHQGTMKYTMMVIPLKEFTIRNGSYVEFRGPMTNPTLNISATESVTTSITEYEETRSVLFNVGLAITQTLENMGLEFTIEAPEDMTPQNELSTMTKEQRGRLAVTMLATGMYISDSSTSNGLSAHNALNAFLQSQISNITGKALKSVDLSLGVTQGTSATGTSTTDYSFRLSKRFWNNRINVIIGGRVSTGTDATNTGKSILDNVTVEYRLDKSATRYVSAFYDKNHESILDGEVTEMGAGLVLRRKTSKLSELFLFRKKKEKKP